MDLDDGWNWPTNAVFDWFVAFLAVDADGVSTEQIASLAKAMLKHRCAYLGVWGPDCKRVH